MKYLLSANPAIVSIFASSRTEYQEASHHPKMQLTEEDDLVTYDSRDNLDPREVL